jgi:hypothetical protein
MLETIALILLVIWGVGFAFHLAGGLIHILLVVGAALLIGNFVKADQAEHV